MARGKGWLVALGALVAAAGGFVAGALMRSSGGAAPPLPTEAPAHPGFPPMSLAPSSRG